MSNPIDVRRGGGLIQRMRRPPSDRPQPRLTPEAEAARAARLARQAAALRQNLRRRKDQARARDDDPSAAPPKEDQK